MAYISTAWLQGPATGKGTRGAKRDRDRGVVGWDRLQRCLPVNFESLGVLQSRIPVEIYARWERLQDYRDVKYVQDREPISRSPPPPRKASRDLLDVAAPWYTPLCDKYRYPQKETSIYFFLVSCRWWDAQMQTNEWKDGTSQSQKSQMARCGRVEYVCKMRGCERALWRFYVKYLNEKVIRFSSNQKEGTRVWSWQCKMQVMYMFCKRATEGKVDVSENRWKELTCLRMDCRM